MQDILAIVQRAFATLGFAEWLAVGSAFAACFSFLLNRGTVKRQERLALESLRAARDTDLIAWASEVIDLLADAQMMCRDMDDGLIPESELLTRRSESRTRISALLDRGRVFFPNVVDQQEKGKAAAFQGKRQKALNAIYAAYRSVSDVTRPGGPTPREAVLAIVEHRRDFVSEVFLHVDPRRRRDIISQLDT